MNLKKHAIFGLVAIVAAVVAAAPSSKAAGKKAGKAAAAVEADDAGPDANVKIEIFPKLGLRSTVSAPSIGESQLGAVWNGKPRKWIVLETKYQTFDKVIDQLTFEWHVLLDTKTAAVKDKEAIAKRAPYSYFTQRVTYSNIPKGFHAASVCLHPSYYEQYGEPKAVGIVITDANGKVLAGDCESEIKGIDSHPKSLEAAFWNNDEIMNAKNPKSADGEPMIERRQGLQDRSKTIWALVSPNDYELVIQ
jgi:hypothetical protein